MCLCHSVRKNGISRPKRYRLSKLVEKAFFEVYNEF